MTFVVLHDKPIRRNAAPFNYDQYIVDNYSVAEAYPMLGTTAAEVQAALGSAAHDGILEGAYTLDNLTSPIVDETEKAPLFNSASFGALRITQAALDTFESLGVIKGGWGIWAKITALGVWTDGVSRNAIALGLASGGTAVPALYINKRSSTSSPRFVYQPAASSYLRDTAITPHTDWMYLAMAWDNSTGVELMRAYYNGVKQGADVATPNDWPAGDFHMRIGNTFLAAPSGQWHGGLCHFHYWVDYMPTDADILGVYNAKDGA